MRRLSPLLIALALAVLLGAALLLLSLIHI